MVRFRTRRRVGVGKESWGFYWNPSLQVIADSMESYENAVYEGTGEVMTEYAQEMEAYMKANHTWMNRTYQAEQTMTAEVVPTRGGNGWRMVLAYGVPYGIYLQAKPEYDIIGPTIDFFAPRIIEELRGIV